jgi:hypothetical protein
VVGRSRAGLWSLRKVALASAFVVLTAASFFVHYQGAMRWTSYAWNVEPVDINRAPSRLWDWKDPPFLRSMRR